MYKPSLNVFCYSLMFACEGRCGAGRRRRGESPLVRSSGLELFFRANGMEISLQVPLL